LCASCNVVLVHDRDELEMILKKALAVRKI
jgi:hypothetical protein